MRTWWKVLIGLVVALPTLAYVAGTLAATGDEPARPGAHRARGVGRAECDGEPDAERRQTPHARPDPAPMTTMTTTTGRRPSRRAPTTSTTTMTTRAGRTMTTSGGRGRQRRGRRRRRLSPAAPTDSRPAAPAGRFRARPASRPASRSWSPLALAGAGLIVYAIESASGSSSRPSTRWTRSSPSSPCCRSRASTPRPASRSPSSSDCSGSSCSATCPTTTSCSSAGSATGPSDAAPDGRRRCHRGPRLPRSGPSAGDRAAGTPSHRLERAARLLVTAAARDATSGRAGGALVVVNFLDEDARRARSTRCAPTRSSSLLSLALVTAVAAWQSGRLLAPLRTPARDRRARSATTDLSRRHPRDRQRRHHRADPDRSTAMLDRLEAAFVGPAAVPRRRRARAADAAHRAARPPRAARRRQTPRRSPRPASCCSTRSTGCPGWSAT